MNPFTLDSAGDPFPLDMRGELDDTAAFKSGKKWGAVEFPLPFGRTMSSAEEHILSMDEATGEQVRVGFEDMVRCTFEAGIKIHRSVSSQECPLYSEIIVRGLE